MKRSRLDEQDITIQDLYPELTPEQQKEAAERLDQYLAIIKRIHERKSRN